MVNIKSHNRIAIFCFRLFIVLVLTFYGVYVMGLVSVSKKQAIFFGIFSIGLLSMWASYHFNQTKLSIPRRYQKPIEFKSDPGNHKSSVLALLVMGILFCAIGISGFVA